MEMNGNDMFAIVAGADIPDREYLTGGYDIVHISLTARTTSTLLAQEAVLLLGAKTTAKLRRIRVTTFRAARSESLTFECTGSIPHTPNLSRRTTSRQVIPHYGIVYSTLRRRRT